MWMNEWVRLRVRENRWEWTNGWDWTLEVLYLQIYTPKLCKACDKDFSPPCFSLQLTRPTHATDKQTSQGPSTVHTTTLDPLSSRNVIALQFPLGSHTLPLFRVLLTSGRDWPWPNGQGHGSGQVTEMEWLHPGYVSTWRRELLLSSSGSEPASKHRGKKQELQKKSTGQASKTQIQFPKATIHFHVALGKSCNPFT